MSCTWSSSASPPHKQYIQKELQLNTQQLVKACSAYDKRTLVVEKYIHVALDESNFFYPLKSNVDKMKNNPTAINEAPQENTEAKSDESV